MKTLKLTTLLLAVALVFGSTSCKYEEGPGLSLRTKTARVTGDWGIDKTIDNDGDVDTDWDGFEITFDKDGTGTQTYTFDFGGVSTTEIVSFKWEFTNSKENIKITDEDGEVIEGVILRLTNNEMWIKDTDDNFQTNFKSK